MVLRNKSFMIDSEIGLVLLGEASTRKMSKNKLVRLFLEQFLDESNSAHSNHFPAPKGWRRSVRAFNITPSQDERLTKLGAKLNRTKGELFRHAIAQGLGLCG